MKNKTYEARVIGNDKTYWIFQYRKKNSILKLNPFQKILNKLFLASFGMQESWALSIPVYRTKKEALKALKLDIKRTKQNVIILK